MSRRKNCTLCGETLDVTNINLENTNICDLCQSTTNVDKSICQGCDNFDVVNYACLESVCLHTGVIGCKHFVPVIPVLEGAEVLNADGKRKIEEYMSAQEMLKLPVKERNDILTEAAKIAEKDRRYEFLNKCDEQYQELREDKEAWEQHQTETNIWDCTLMDGLEDDVFDKLKDIEYAKEMIINKCDELKEFLSTKNESYGNSVFNPLRILAKNANILERLGVRIDDKLNRIFHGQSYPGDNDVNDLGGYFVLLLVALDEVKRRLNV